MRRRGPLAGAFLNSSVLNKTDALSKLDTAATRARKAFNAYMEDDYADVFYYLDLLFGGEFPAR